MVKLSHLVLALSVVSFAAGCAEQKGAKKDDKKDAKQEDKKEEKKE